jgi:hypothetical protein
MESWLSATKGRKPQTQEELVRAYGNPDKDGELDEWSFETPADHFGMDYDKMKDGALTVDYLNAKLKKGHVLLFYKVGAGVAHAVVVYGVGYPTGEAAMVSVMDPWTGGYRNIPLSDFSSGPKIVAWPNW